MSKIKTIKITEKELAKFVELIYQQNTWDTKVILNSLYHAIIDSQFEISQS